MLVQIGGPVGSFVDQVQQRQVPVEVVGTCDYSGPPGDPAQLDQYVRTEILRAIRDVIGAKMASAQLTFRHLGTGDIAFVVPEIVAASRLEQNGFRVGNLSMWFGIDGHVPQPPAPQPQQPQLPRGAPPPNLGTGQVVMSNLGEHLKERAKTEVIWYAMGCGILLVVLLGLGGLGLYIWSAASDTSTPSSVAAGKWDGKTPFTCSGGDVITIKDVKANVTGTAVTATGGCALTLVNVDLTAETGIESRGSASVTMQGGSINGTTFAVHATAASVVDLKGTKVTGKKEAVAAAKINGP